MLEEQFINSLSDSEKERLLEVIERDVSGLRKSEK